MAVTPNTNLIYREEKGPFGNELYNLTPQEVDGNFKNLDEKAANLNTRITTLEANPAATTPDVFTELPGDLWSGTNDSTKRFTALTSNRALVITDYSESFVAMLRITTNNNYTLSINGTDITNRLNKTGTTLIGLVHIGGGVFEFDSNLIGAVAPVEENPIVDPDVSAYLARFDSGGMGYQMTMPQREALQTFVTGLKNSGLFAGIYEMWPLRGGIPSLNKLAFKSSARDLTFVGDGKWTHELTGSKSNAIIDTNSVPYADTHVLANELSVNNMHISVYSRSNISGGDDFSVFLGADQIARLIARDADTIIADLGSTSQRVTVANTNSVGLFTGTRTASNFAAVYKNGVQQMFNNAENTGTLPAENFYLGAINNRSAGNGSGYFAGNPSAKEYAFASIGEGRTPQQEATFSGLVTDFLTAFNSL